MDEAALNAAAEKITVKRWSFAEDKFGCAETTPMTVNVDGKAKSVDADVSSGVKSELPYV